MTVPALEPSEQDPATGDLALRAVLVDHHAIRWPVFPGGQSSPKRPVRATGLTVFISRRG
jgi:hypothetical protein